MAGSWRALKLHRQHDSAGLATSGDHSPVKQASLANTLFGANSDEPRSDLDCC